MESGSYHLHLILSFSIAGLGITPEARPPPTQTNHTVMAQKRNTDAPSKAAPEKAPASSGDTVLVLLRRNWPSAGFRRTVCGNQIAFNSKEPVELNAEQCQCVARDIGRALVIVDLNDKGLPVVDWDETAAVRKALEASKK